MPALTINSHSSNLKCLDIFFKQMEKCVGVGYFDKIYLLIDPVYKTFPEYVSVINYDPKDSFKDQMTSFLSQIEDEIIMYCNEDYIFYSQADLNKANTLLAVLKNTDFSFIKFVHTDIEQYTSVSSNLYLIDKNCANNFSQAMSFWKRKDILKIHQGCPRSEIGKKGETHGHLELLAREVCRNLNIKGLCYYNGEPKRGEHHFDTDIFPHIASALIKGEWNTREYPELTLLLKEQAF